MFTHSGQIVTDMVSIGIAFIYPAFSLITLIYLIWGTHAENKRKLWGFHGMTTIFTIVFGGFIGSPSVVIVIVTAFFTGTTIISFKLFNVCDYCASLNKSYSVFSKMYYCNYCGAELDESMTNRF